MLNRASVSVLVIPNSSEMWWRKRDFKVNRFIYDIMMTTTRRDFSIPESTNMLGLDVKIRSMQEDELFVKWVGLSII